MVLSPGLWGIANGIGTSLKASIQITTMLMSAGIFIYGNYRIFTSPDNQTILAEIITTEDYSDALKELRSKKTLAPKIDLLIGQIARIDKKESTLTNILLQKFSAEELSFKKFQETILQVKNIFYLNLRSVINKMMAFDDREYNLITEKQEIFSVGIRNEKLAIYVEYLTFFSSAIEENEEILLKFDKLLLEISKLSSFESGDLEKMAGMREISYLIQNAKLYK